MHATWSPELHIHEVFDVVLSQVVCEGLDPDGAHKTLLDPGNKLRVDG